jgi:hypothetical protein
MRNFFMPLALISMRQALVTVLLGMVIALGMSLSASARSNPGETIGQSGAANICHRHGGTGASGTGCAWCGKINCTTVICPGGHSGNCNVRVQKLPAAARGNKHGGRPGKLGFRPPSGVKTSGGVKAPHPGHGRVVQTGGLKAKIIYRRSTGPTNPNGPDTPGKDKGPFTMSEHHGDRHR